MLKATFLQGTLRFTITLDGPLLIKAGETGGADPARPDMEFVRTGVGRDTVYLPGPSLKGVVRAQAERICRTLDHGNRDPGADNPPLADNPLGDGATYRGLNDLRYNSGRYIESIRERIAGDADRTATIYRRSSFVSQLFGHTALAGRVRFADAYPKGTITLEERNGVAIDRVYGSVAVGPFNYEVAVDGSFTTQLDFRNVSLAQLGLLGLVLRDLEEGLIGVGFGKSRGLGRVKVSFDELTVRYPLAELRTGGVYLLTGQQPFASANELAGLGACLDAATAGSYGLRPNDRAPLPPGLEYTPDDLLGIELRATGHAAVKSIWRACIPAWREKLGL